MYNCIKNYCENNEENGLFLLDMPTGFGKTYNVIKYIYDSSLDPKNKGRKIFFITTMKKNLPIKELKTLFYNAGKIDEFNTKFLFLDSLSEAAITNYNSSMRIPSSIRNTEEYKQFRDGIEFLKSKDNHNDRAYKSYYSDIRKEFSRTTEPAFRKLIQNELFRQFKTIKDRLYAIKTDEKWQWVGELYPSVFTSERQIIFMSMDKFLVLNDTLVERKYLFYNSPIIINAIIFIDEFDATKGTILNSIIQNGLRDRIDYIELFNEIYSTIKTIKFPKDLIVPSKERLNSKYKAQSLESVLNGVEEKADDIFNEYSLQFNHKTDDSQDNSKSFLFQDHRFLSVLNNNHSYILSQKDQDSRYNIIRFSAEKPKAEKNNIQSLLGSLRGFVTWFQTAVHILSLNYMQCRNEQRADGEDEYSLEYAVRTVLSLFRLKQSYENYLITQILLNTKKDRGGVSGSEYDMTFYDKGFRYYAFEDSPEHAMESRIIMYSFQNTPEKYLLRFCEKAKVVGISATATIASVIGNYDLEYLNAKMNRLLHYIGNEEQKRLQQEFENAQKGYEHVKINVGIIDVDDNDGYSVNSWLRLFNSNDPDSHEAAEHVYNKVQLYCPDSADGSYYFRKRYLRIVMAFKEFIVHDDIYSFLCVLTSHPKPYDKLLSINLLTELFGIISEYYGCKDYCVKQLDGEEYDQKKDEIYNLLSDGKKVFVISVYQTIGAGQNLQYKAPRSLLKTLVKINDRKDGDEKDFDAIYLDRPTNLMVNINSEVMNDENFIESIFQHEFLQEKGEISQVEASKRIKGAFQKYLFNAKGRYKGLDTRSVKLLATKVIIQAVGRICRTNLKSKNIYLFADRGISEWVDASVLKGHVYNREFIELISKMKLSDTSDADLEILNRANLLASKANLFIRRMLPSKNRVYTWDTGKLEQWKLLRKISMQNPTFDYENDNSFVVKQLYIKQPQKSNHYYYSQSEDYNNIRISFSADNNADQMVSMQAARLDRILKFDGLPEFFKNNNYAMVFEPNEYILSPAMFNNIYKGALGEAVGWYIFKRFLNIKLEEIDDPEVFELFDYRVPGTDVYVDFKHWTGSNQDVDNSDIILEKIRNKARICGCRCVIIANILSERFFEARKTKIDDVVVVKCPSLLMDKGANVELNKNAVEIIRRCINEFRDQNKSVDSQYQQGSNL